jgi:hypothetical protein
VVVNLGKEEQDFACEGEALLTWDRVSATDGRLVLPPDSAAVVRR